MTQASVSSSVKPPRQNWRSGAAMSGVTRGLRFLTSPWTLIAAFVALAALALTAPLNMPLGSYYWDINLYPDAAWRIANGQMPHIDFFVPAGAFEYYGYAALQWLFPRGHMLLAANFSVLLAALPLFAFTLWRIDSTSRPLALALLVPFLIFAALPLNTTELFPMAGVDGYAIYNRHVSLLLYVLATALLFADDRRLHAVVVAGLLLALFFTKITGAVIALGLIVHALAAGTLRPAAAAGALALTAAAIALVEWSTGLVSAYLGDIAIMIELGQSNLIASLRSPLVMHFDIILPALAAAALVLWNRREDFAALLRSQSLTTAAKSFQAVCNNHGAWIVSLAVAALLLESQNTGGLEMIILWPALARMLAEWAPRKGASGARPAIRTALIVLTAFAVIPTVSQYLHRATRIAAATATYEPVQAPALAGLGRVSARSEFLERAPALNAHYAAAREQFDRLAAQDHQISYLHFTEIDFQVAWMLATQEAIDAIARYEAAHDMRFSSFLVLDFVDPITFLMQRQPLRLISIGKMVERTVPPLEGERLAAAQEASAVLYPVCPINPTRMGIRKEYAAVMEGRKKVSLSPCWDMYIKP